MDELGMTNTLLRVSSIVLLDREDYDADAVFSGITNRIMRRISYRRNLDDWFAISNYDLEVLTESPYYFVAARARLVYRYNFIRYLAPHDFRNPYSTLYPCYQINFDGIMSHPDVAKTLNRNNIPFIPYELIRLPARL